MSIVIAYGFDAFSVVATDTRVHYAGGRSRDDANKLSLIESHGWATGLGFELTIRGVIEGFSSFGPWELGRRLASAELAWGMCRDLLWTRFPGEREQIEGTRTIATLPWVEAGRGRFVMVSREGAEVLTSRRVVLPEELASILSYPPLLDDPRANLWARMSDAVRGIASLLEQASRSSTSISNIADVGVSWSPDLHRFPPRMRFRGPASQIVGLSDDELVKHVSDDPWSFRS